MLLYQLCYFNTTNGLVSDAMNVITEIIRTLFRRAQLYDQDILAVKIVAITVQFVAKFNCGTTDRRMLQ
jgi:hypothetical protein